MSWPKYETSSTHPAARELLNQLLTYRTGIVESSSFLLKNRVLWIISKFVECITFRKCFVVSPVTFSWSKREELTILYFDIPHQTIINGLLFGAQLTSFGRSKPNTRQFYLFTNPDREKFPIIEK